MDHVITMSPVQPGACTPCGKIYHLDVLIALSQRRTKKKPGSVIGTKSP